MQDPEIPALSHYVPAFEGPEDKLTAKYPLQLITWKGKNRANSTQYANPWLQEVQTQKLWLNPQDAKQRGISEGDSVKIYNDRGVSIIPVEITPYHPWRSCYAGGGMVATGCTRYRSRRLCQCTEFDPHYGAGEREFASNNAGGG